MITYPTAAPRLAFGKAALGLVATAAAVLGCAGSASAAVISPAPGNTLSSAITTANTNADASNIILLADGRYTPSAPLPAITKKLTITSDHSIQVPAPGGGPRIDCSTNPTSSADFMTVNSGVNVTLESFVMTGCATQTFGTIHDKGTLTTWGMEISGNVGAGLIVDSGASATLNETGVHDGLQVGINDNGALTLNNSTVANNTNGGIVHNGAGSTVTLNNSIVANNNPSLQANTFDCSPAGVTSVDQSMDSDNSCHVPAALSGQNPNFDFSSNTLGGPVSVLDIVSPSPAQGVGDPAKCPTTDARYFVHTSANCDLGYYQIDGVRDTTPPSCPVTGGSAGPPATQQVTVTDTESGMGPEAQSAFDPNSAAATGPYPTSATSVPGDAISGLGINNGTVAFTPFTTPSRSGLVLTATKATAGTLTTWWFTATDWAGNTRLCK